MSNTFWLRGLGVLSICAGAVSFLLEGWTTFTGLEKYLAFFGFFLSVYLLAEFLSRSSSVTAKVLAGLAVALATPVSLQLGSFILDQYPNATTSSYVLALALPADAPLEFICAASFLLACAVVARSLRLLEVKNFAWEIGHFILTSLLLILPVRSALYQGPLFLCFGLMTAAIARRSHQSNELSLPLLALHLVPLLLLLRRIGLYAQHESVTMALQATAAVLCFTFVPAMCRDYGLRMFFYGVGYIALLLLARDIAENFDLSSDHWKLAVTVVFTLAATLRYRESSKFGLFFLSVVIWCNFLGNLFAAFDLMTTSIAIGYALLLLSVSFYLRQGFAFAESSALLICAFAHLLIKTVQLPEVNLWMVFGFFGIALLLCSAMFERPQSKALELWARGKDFFNRDL